MPALSKERTSAAHTASLGAKKDAQLDAQIDALLAGRHADPFALLGPHPVSTPGGLRWVIRFFHPAVADASVLLQGASEPIPARRLRPEGFFEVPLPDSQQSAPAPSSYRIRFRTGHGETVETFDTYAFPYLPIGFDLHLLAEGRHYAPLPPLPAHLKP